MPDPADKSADQAKQFPKQRRRNWLSFSLRSLLILVTLCCLAVGGKLKYDWYRKKWLAEAWVAPLVKDARAGIEANTSVYNPQNRPPVPPGVKAEQEIELLGFGILELDSSEQRFSALKILVESRKEESLPALRDLLLKSRHPEMQAMLLHLISLSRDPSDITVFQRFLTSRHAEVRGAAAESIGYIHEPAYGFAPGPDFWGSEILLNTQPMIDASFFVNSHPVPVENQRAIERERQSKISASSREPLEEMMLHGPTPEERTAAARALVSWPPASYQLRYAEWGVWIDGPRRLEVSKSVLEEIPPFVHRMGNAAASLPRNRFEGPIVITKPVVHLTSNRPLAVDLEIGIVSGRPWYAFPRPDTFTVHLDSWPGNVPEMTAAELSSLDPSNLPILEPLSEGYPWIHPSVRSAGKGTAAHASGSGVTQIGLRWQSLIVSPNHEAWMSPPAVPAGKSFAWWKSLREVPSSWVTSQGETERFLYYDGPTLAKSPVSATLQGDQLHLESQDLFLHRLKEGEKKEFAALAEKGTEQRDCLFVEVREGKTRSFQIRLSTALGHKESLDLAAQSWQTSGEVEQALRRILHEHGLTKEETAGFITSWREKFLQAPGRRLLTFLTHAEYNRMCPLKIGPKTTEEVRVGVVLTEL